MKKTKEELCFFLKELGLIYRKNETDEQIKQRVLDDGAWIQEREIFLSKELQDYLIKNGIKPCDTEFPDCVKTKGDIDDKRRGK